MGEFSKGKSSTPFNILNQGRSPANSYEEIFTAGKKDDVAGVREGGKSPQRNMGET